MYGNQYVDLLCEAMNLFITVRMVFHVGWYFQTDHNVLVRRGLSVSFLFSILNLASGLIRMSRGFHKLERSWGFLISSILKYGCK